MAYRDRIGDRRCPRPPMKSLFFGGLSHLVFKRGFDHLAENGRGSRP
jgi:hypothetical protein